MIKLNKVNATAYEGGTAYPLDIIAGDHSEVVESVKKEVLEIIRNTPTEIQNEIKESVVQALKPGIVIFLGDSYAQGYNTSTGTVFERGWMQQVYNRLKATDRYKDTRILSYYHGGAGFANDGTAGGNSSGTFQNMLATTGLTETERSNVSDIYVFGGFNDIKQSTNEPIPDLETRVNGFMAYAKTNYPKAVVHVGVISNTTNKGWKRALMKVIDIYRTAVLTNAGVFHEGLNTVLREQYIDYSEKETANGGIHPGGRDYNNRFDTRGWYAVANAIYNSIVGEQDPSGKIEILYEEDISSAKSFFFKEYDYVVVEGKMSDDATGMITTCLYSVGTYRMSDSFGEYVFELTDSGISAPINHSGTSKLTKIIGVRL